MGTLMVGYNRFSNCWKQCAIVTELCAYSSVPRLDSHMLLHYCGLCCTAVAGRIWNLSASKAVLLSSTDPIGRRTIRLSICVIRCTNVLWGNWILGGRAAGLPHSTDYMALRCREHTVACCVVQGNIYLCRR